MNNDALVAALGVDAVACVRGYRLQVIAEGARRDVRLVTSSPPQLVPVCADAHLAIDPIEIRLTVLPSPGCDGLAGRVLGWSPASGWALSRPAAGQPIAYYAGPCSDPMHLVPTPPQVVDWVTGGPVGSVIPPSGVELDDDPAAIRRLLAFADPKYQVFLREAFAGRTPREPAGPAG